MNSKCELSVVVMTYFHEDYLRKCIDSILSQRVTFSYEILISDDKSEDSTVDIIKDYHSKNPDIIRYILNEENVGITKNLYSALKECSGDYIILVSGDDCLTDSFILQKEYDFLNKRKDCIACCCLVESVYTDGTSVGRVSPEQKYWNTCINREDFLEGHNFPTAGMMFRNVINDTDIFSIIPKFSRDIDDLTLGIIIFEFGNVFVLNRVGYAITTRRDTDLNQHNYNTKYGKLKNAKEHIRLISNIQKYYGRKIDLSKRIEPHLSYVLYYIAKTKKINEAKILFEVPFIQLCLIILSKINKKLKN